MGEYDDERASITGRQITANAHPKAWPLTERQRRVQFGILLGIIGMGPAILILAILFQHWRH